MDADPRPDLTPRQRLDAWLKAHAPEVARAWDQERGRISWERYRERQAPGRARMTVDERQRDPEVQRVREQWEREVRAPAVRHWGLAAAMEQGVVTHREALAYAAAHRIAGYQRGAHAEEQQRQRGWGQAWAEQRAQERER